MRAPLSMISSGSLFLSIALAGCGSTRPATQTTSAPVTQPTSTAAPLEARLAVGFVARRGPLDGSRGAIIQILTAVERDGRVVFTSLEDPQYEGCEDTTQGGPPGVVSAITCRSAEGVFGYAWVHPADDPDALTVTLLADGEWEEFGPALRRTPDGTPAQARPFELVAFEAVLPSE